MNLLALDEEGGDSLNGRLIALFDILQDALLQCRILHVLKQDGAVDSNLVCECGKDWFRIRSLRPLALKFKQCVVHLPVMALLACRFRGFGCGHGVRVDGDQWEVMKFQSDFRWIPVQYFLYERMI